MEAAYSAGQARLSEFMPRKASRPEMTENRYWRSRQNASMLSNTSPLNLNSHMEATPVAV